MLTGITRRFSLCSCLLAVCSSLALASASSAVGITIGAYTGSSVLSQADDASGPRSNMPAGFEALPTSGTLTAIDGAASSTTQYTLTNLGFSWTMEHVGVTAVNATSQTFSTIYFIPDADVDYVISGSYGLLSGAPLVSLGFGIREDVAGPFVYQANHQSRGIAGESFTLGVPGGTEFNSEEGAITGTLVGGQQYILSLNARVFSHFGNTGPSHASGSVNIAFVPEPSTAALVGIGLTGLATRRRSHRAR